MSSFNLKIQKRVDHIFGSILILVLKIPTMIMGELLRRDHTLEFRRDVLFIKLVGGGSLLMAYPSLEALRQKYPDTRFKLLCSRQITGFAELLGVFDEIIEIDSSSPWMLAKSTVKAWFQAFRVDTVVDLEVHSKLTTIFAVFLAARNRVGFFMGWNRWKNGLTTHALFGSDSTPVFEFYQLIARLFHTDPLPFPQAHRRFEARLLGANPSERSNNYRVTLGCFSSELCAEREFNAESWLKVFAHHIPSPTVDVELVLLGGKADHAKAEKFKGHWEGRLGPQFKVLNLCGQLSLNESSRLIAGSDLFLTIDSGLNHIARLLSVPIVSFWGPTDPARLLTPRLFGQEQVHYKRVICSPCVHLVSHPPCRGDNICMKRHFEDSIPSTKTMPWLCSLGSING